MLKKILFSPLTLFIGCAFLVTSWPFFFYPLTDGDIIHWVKIAQDIRLNGHFFTGAHDQAHGPLLAWTAGLFSQLLPTSFYLLALFNILCGLWGVALTYFFSLAFWKNAPLAKLCTVIFSTSLVYVYLSRTPMYDWPAAVFYFGFCGFYCLSILQQKKRYFFLALLHVALSSLTRFSIAIGLSELFMGLSLLIFYKNKTLSFKTFLKNGILHGASIFLVALIVNLPWLLGHYLTLGPDFLYEFIYDNVGRYIQEPGNSVVHRDYYGFLAYALLGILPYSMCLIAAVCQKDFWARVKTDTLSHLMLAAWVPCLLFFSFSGHVKLARYVAYIFPPLLLFLSFHLYHDLKRPAFIRLCKRITLGLCGILAILLINQAFHFDKEALESLPLVGGCIGLVFGLLGLTYFHLFTRTDTFLSHPERSLWGFATVYLTFFSILTYESLHSPFLVIIRHTLLEIILAQ